MTDLEFYEALKPLEPKMAQFSSSGTGALTSTDVQLIKSVYPKLVQLSNGYVNRYFNSGCSTCVRKTFQIIISVYERLKGQFDVTTQIKNKRK